MSKTLTNTHGEAMARAESDWCERHTVDCPYWDTSENSVEPHACESVLTPDGHGAYCRWCGEATA